MYIINYDTDSIQIIKRFFLFGSFEFIVLV